jgi:hypothetical protein
MGLGDHAALAVVAQDCVRIGITPGSAPAGGIARWLKPNGRRGTWPDAMAGAGMARTE